MEHDRRRRGEQGLWDRIWKDPDGKVVIWEMPNLPLIVWAVFTGLSVILSKGTLADVCSWIGSAALIIWSLLEIFRGVNYFRRALGLLVLIFAIASLIKN